MFSKVNAKFSREPEPVAMNAMLSREEHKTLYAIKPKPPRDPVTYALKQFGYSQHTTDSDFNLVDLHDKILSKRQDRCIFGFDKFLPRKYRQSIYSGNDGIQESCVVDKNKSYSGKDNFTFNHDARPLHFRYEKSVSEQDMNNS